MPRRYLTAASQPALTRRRPFRAWRTRVVTLGLVGLTVSVLSSGTPHRDVTSHPVAAPAARLATTYLPMYVGNYETGLRQFQSTPWNNQPYAPTLVRTPTFDGGYAGRYVIPAGGHRCESVPNLRSFRSGDNLWFRFSTRLGSDFPVSSSRWQVLAQWKNSGDGSPPLELVVSGGVWRLDGGWGYPGQHKLDWRLLGKARTNVWETWTLHVKFSANPAIGAVSLRRNGVAVVPGWRPKGGTLYPGQSSYMKIGYYRDPLINQTGTVYHDRLKVGSTPWSVV